YRIELRAGGVLCREGELILQLMHGADLLVSIAFSFLRNESGIAIGIGCLQGHPGSGSLEAIRSATRELHGARPKNLLVRMVRQFGHDLGCAQLVLVGNRNRVVTTSMRQGKVHADYDGLWEELNAWRRPDGDFGLACEDLPAPRMEEIASKKRSEARKRHEMLLAAVDALRAQLVRSQRSLLPLRLVHSAGAAPRTAAAPLLHHA
ncbi:MAG: VirK/YbjX family protein, partial [Pseudomonadota bacterium]|nr:VirK/YbjX family protein [Pseudomonadota bacterium]